MTRGKRSSGGGHRFGGDWTEQKLQVLDSYLGAYVTALKNQPFHKIYIDAFAGTGYRTERETEEPGATLSFPHLAEEAPQRLLEGSAARALRVEPAFDEHIFIEKSRKRADELTALRQAHPTRKITIVQGDANSVVQTLCAGSWRNRRAVLFLDPYGMQVEWSTIAAVARTQAIDMWLLFPLGIGVDRLITRSGHIPEGWRRRLDLLFGTPEWAERLSRVERERTLFGEEDVRRKASREVIGEYFLSRLKSVFAGVAEPALVLSNSVGCPLYLFCFAAANPAGAKVALKMAGHLIKGMS